MGDLRELIEKLEKLEAPSREVDLEIARHVLPDVICMRYNRETRTNEQFVHWQYTASLDAAISLCERLFPGTEIDITNLYGVARAGINLNLDAGPSYGEHWSGNLALAVLHATLRAKAQESGR